MATFVLVHGGWFGGWCWQSVADSLRTNGHAVFTPTLTGLGERSHLASPQITLKTHAQDIANVLFYEDLHDVILLGHSYSGMPLSLVPGLAAERIKRLVYLDAFVPEHNQSIKDLAGIPPLQAAGISWLMPPPSLDRWHVTDPDLIAFIEPRLTPHISLSNVEKVDLTDVPQLPCSYISLTRNQKKHFINIAERLEQDPNWDIYELDAGHLVMAEEPDLLAEFLNDHFGNIT